MVALQRVVSVLHACMHHHITWVLSKWRRNSMLQNAVSLQPDLEKIKAALLAAVRTGLECGVSQCRRTLAQGPEEASLI